jgi:FtsP/CotA-like multicopper oxidase with cupredoxin domain
VTQDGWQPVPPGEETTYRLRAEPFGLHPYHCDASPAAEHLSHGLYGMLIVDPAAGRPPAHELALVLSGFDLDGDGHNELYGWNGVAGFYERYPIKVPVGAPVRVYLLNMVADDPVASFHLHAETFDVYRSGTRLVPDERTDVVTLAQTERAIVEFRLPRRGRYMFHPHQRHMAERGAMGWFAAV